MCAFLGYILKYLSYFSYTCFETIPALHFNIWHKFIAVEHPTHFEIYGLLYLIKRHYNNFHINNKIKVSFSCITLKCLS